MERLLTRGDVANILQISLVSLHRLVNRKELKPVYVGGLPRFQPTEVERFIENLSVKKAAKKVA